MRSLGPVLVVGLFLIISCGTSGSSPGGGGNKIVEPLTANLRETPDPDNLIFTVSVDGGKVVGSTRTEIPKEAFSSAPFDRQKDVKEPEPREPGKLHPLLEKWMTSRKGDEVEEVVITFRDNLQIPRFPEPVVTESRDSATNKQVLARNAELVESVRAKRAEDYDRMASRLSQYNAKITEQFWLVRAFEATMPLGTIRELAAQEDVLYVEPVQTNDPPPQNGNANDDVDDGRARLNSDPYFALGQTAGFIGLLDTGIRATHVQFVAPDHVDFLRDCVNGGANCNTGALNTADDCWNHGTSSAGIITGNDRQGAAFRGVTAITLDSFKVYPSTFNGTNCTGFLNTTAVVRGFQTAVAVADRVIVAEMQGSGDHTSAISVAADNAFDAGAVIIAANGNNGDGASTVNTPANAHRVLGIGNFDVQTMAAIPGQSRGPTADNRIKPDVQAPTNTETASTGCAFGVQCAQSDTAFRVYGGTSGATPYGAGAAALVRNFLRGNTGVIDPGHVYSFLIMSGQTTVLTNITGAGPIRLPVNGTFAFGRVSIGNGQTINIPFGVGGANRLDVALWWPETTPQAHNDVDLHLVNPGGGTSASSVGISTIFERARITNPVAGTWTVRIRGFSVPSAPQTVFWTAAAHNQ